MLFKVGQQVILIDKSKCNGIPTTEYGKRFLIGEVPKENITAYYQITNLIVC